MTASRVIEIIREVLSSHHLFPPEMDITADSSMDDLRADDIDRIGIAMKVEETFGFIMSDREERELSSVQDIIDIVGLRARTPEGSPA